MFPCCLTVVMLLYRNTFLSFFSFSKKYNTVREELLYPEGDWNSAPEDTVNNRLTDIFQREQNNMPSSLVRSFYC